MEKLNVAAKHNHMQKAVAFCRGTEMSINLAAAAFHICKMCCF